MSTQTTNYGLVKPEAQDFIDIGVINGNMDKLDAFLKTKYGTDNKPTADDVGALSTGGGTVNGTVSLNDISGYAEQLRLFVYNGETYLRHYRDDNNYKDFRFGISGEVTVQGAINGEFFTYTLLHTGNSSAVVATASRE